MNKQEVISQVTQQLEQADFTPVIVSLLRQSTGNVLNRAKQSLDATIQENTNPQVATLLNVVGTEVNNATTEWVDASTGQLVVFPEGTRFVSKDNQKIVVVLEEKPKVRNINFKYMSSPNQTVRHSVYPISLPYIYFVADFINEGNNNYRFNHLFMACSKTPITSLDSQVNALPLPNVHAHHQICTGNMNLAQGTSIVQKMNTLISGYWNSEFNTDLTHFLTDFMMQNQLVPTIRNGDDFAQGFARWAELTRQNPTWAIQPTTRMIRNFAISTLISTDNGSRTSRAAIINRVKTRIDSSISSLGDNIMQTVRAFNLNDENRDRSHLETLKSLYNRVIASAYDNLWNPLHAAHEQQKQADLAQVATQRQAFERNQREAEAQRQRNEAQLNRDRQAFEQERSRWLQEKTTRENQLVVARDYLQRKLAEVGSSVQQAINPAAAPAAAAPATPAISQNQNEPAVIPNPPGYTGRGRRRIEPWYVGSIHRKKQEDGSYITHVWNGRVWERRN